MNETQTTTEMTAETLVPEATSEEAMISNLRSYRQVKAKLEEQRERARMLLAQVEAEIAQDLAPLEREMEALRASMRAFIAEHNDGGNFKVPGLGSAYIQSRRQTKVVDEDSFVAEVRSMYSEEDAAALYDEPRFNLSRGRKFAEAVLKDTGEILPGVESEETQALTVRLSGGER